jgi:hypothetical protein
VTVDPPVAEPEPAISVAAEASDVPGVRLPIYDSIESEWFRRGSTALGRRGSAGGATWTSRADEGFRRAAETVSAPVSGQVTSAGLPQRVPSANLVPGSISARPAPERAGQAPPLPEGRNRSPEAVRARLAGFQTHGRDGRADAPPRPGTQ